MMQQRTPPLLVFALFAALLLTSQRARAASEPYEHDRFYLSAEAGPGLLWAHSSGSISNNFLQKVPSSALAPAAPALSLALGGTLRSYHLTLGGRLGVARGVNAVVDTLGTRFSVPAHDLLLVEIGPFAEYYPDLKGGLHFGASFGGAFLGFSGSSEGAAPGFSGSLQVGHGFFVLSQLSIGATFRLSVARTYSHEEVDVATTTVLPALLLAVTWH